MSKISKYFKKIFKKQSKFKIKPQTIIIDISYNCNAACPFCTRQMAAEKICGFMDKKMFYEIMKQVEKIKSIKCVCLAAWGEATMHPDFDEFVDYIKIKKYILSFPTNMSLAHKHFDSLLKADEIMISAEGYDKTTYENLRKNLNFEQTLSNVKKLDELIKEKRDRDEKTPNRTLNFLLTKSSNISGFLNTWEQYVDKIRIGPVLPLITWNNQEEIFSLISSEKLEDEILELKDKIENMYCNQIFNTIVVRYNGKLALCCSDYNSKIDLGNYKNLKQSYFKNKNLNKIRKEFKENNLVTCTNCFQNIGISKDELFKEFPELEIVNKNKVTIYFNR